MKFRSLLTLTAFVAMLFSSAQAAPAKVGDAAPIASGTTEAGTKLNLADVYAQQPYTLVYFYPKADTPGCTKQGCSLRDSYEALTKKGVAVIGVSMDNAADQKAFKDKYHLPFTLIADTDKSVINAFGVPATNHASRQAYLIKDGKVVWADYKAATEKQAEDVLKVLDQKS